MTSRTILRAIPLTLALLFTACSEDAPLQPTPTPNPARLVKSIRVTPSDPSLVVHKSLRLSAVALDADGEELPSVRVTFAKGNHDVFHLESDGVVTGAKPGVGVLYAEVGFVREYVSVNVLDMPAVSLGLDVETLQLTVGDEVALTATLRDENGVVLGGRPLAWASDDASIASVSATGAVTAVAAGETRITVQHEELTAEVVVVVAEPPTPPAEFGGSLLFVRHDAAVGRPRVFRADANRIDETAQDVFGAAGASQPVVSPDGRRLAFTCDGPHGPGICVSQANGTQVVELTGSDAYHEDHPTWSPDGEQLAFRRWPHGATPGAFNPPDIWTMRADGTAQVNLTADPAIQGNPVWGPTGIGAASRIAYVQESIVDGFLRSQLFTMRADGSDRRALTASAEREDLMPSWRPDGSEIVFVRRGGSQFGDLVLVNVATGAERALLTRELADEQWHPVWSPNGAYIAFTSVHELSPDGGFRRQVYTVRADGSALARRSTGNYDKLGLAWAPLS